MTSCGGHWVFASVTVYMCDWLSRACGCMDLEAHTYVCMFVCINDQGAEHNTDTFWVLCL